MVNSRLYGWLGERARAALAASLAFRSFASASDSVLQGLGAGDCRIDGRLRGGERLVGGGLRGARLLDGVLLDGDRGGGLPGRGSEVSQGLDGGPVLGVGLRGVGLGRLQRFSGLGGGLLGRARFRSLGGGLYLVESSLGGLHLLGGSLLGKPRALSVFSAATRSLSSRSACCRASARAR